MSENKLEEDVVITKEQYKKLNDYFKDLGNILSYNDDIFLDNLRAFGVMGAGIADALEDINLEITPKKDCFTFLEIFDKAKDIMKEIEPNYVEDFDKIMSSGVLEADYNRLDIPYNEREPGMSIFFPHIDEQTSKYEPDKSVIYISESFNYDTIAVLIHEYFHLNNESSNKARYVLTEFISMYFELYTYELLKHKGVDVDNLSLNCRLNDLDSCSRFLREKAYYFYAYEKLGDFDDKTYDYVDFSSVTRNRFNEGLLQELKDFEELEDRYNKTPYLKNRYETKEEYIASKYNSDYRYFIGGILAYYSLYNLSKDDILRLNETLKNNKEIRFSGAMKELGIELDFNTLNDSIECIKRYAKENNLYKQEENNMKM